MAFYSKVTGLMQVQKLYIVVPKPYKYEYKGVPRDQSLPRAFVAHERMRNRDVLTIVRTFNGMSRQLYSYKLGNRYCKDRQQTHTHTHTRTYKLDTNKVFKSLSKGVGHHHDLGYSHIHG